MKAMDWRIGNGGGHCMDQDSLVLEANGRVKGKVMAYLVVVHITISSIKDLGIYVMHIESYYSLALHMNLPDK